MTILPLRDSKKINTEWMSQECTTVMTQKKENRYKTINAQMRCQIPSITKKLSEYVTIKDTNINPHENGQPKMR